MFLFANLKKDDIIKTQLPMEQIVEKAINRISSTEKNLANIQIAPNFEDSIDHTPWIEEVWYNSFKMQLNTVELLLSLKLAVQNLMTAITNFG